MALALFDLDNTLLAGDSDYLWGVFLGEEGVVDPAYYARENERFYQEYREGRLDIFEFLEFSLAPLAQHSMQELQTLHQRFMQTKIEPLIQDAALELVDKHRQRGDQLLVITATNAFVTRPIVERFGIQQLIATEPEQIAGRYTGRVAGIPAFREGKVKRLENWLQQHRMNLQDSWFYSDSHNDLPLLERVDHPVAVDPDTTLEQLAIQRNWPILRLHNHAASAE